MLIKSAPEKLVQNASQLQNFSFNILTKPYFMEICFALCQRLFSLVHTVYQIKQNTIKLLLATYIVTVCKKQTRTCVLFILCAVNIYVGSINLDLSIFLHIFGYDTHELFSCALSTTLC